MGAKPEKAPFQPIAPNAPEKPSRDAVAAFAEERGAPSLEARRKSEALAAEAPKPAPRGPVARLNLEIPAELRPQLKKRAFEEDISILAIVLRALAKDGFEIDPADLVADRRKG